MKKRSFVAAALATAIALTMTACGGSNGSNSGNDAANGDVVNLKIWSPSDRESIEKWWVEKIDEWNAANPDIQVSRDAIDRSDSYAYDNKVATAVTSNDLPDILFVDGPQVAYYAANGVTVPITDFFTEDDMNDFVDSTVAECTYDGDLYAIAPTESSVALYYNKEYLTECGVDVAKMESYTVDNPITWSEMAELAKQCTTDNYVGIRIVMDHGEGLPYALEPMYVSNGKDFISEDGTTANGYVNSAEAVETTAYLAQLIADGYANVDPITDEFLNGGCAMQIMGSWDVSTLANADFEWGVTYYPVSDNTGTPVSPCGDWAAAITKDCENVDAAGKFMQWLMSSENVASYASAIAKPASRSSAYDTEYMADYKEYPLSVFVEQLENNASPRPRTPSYATFSTAYAEAMSNIFSEAASNSKVDKNYIQEQLDNVVTTFEDDYNSYYAE